MPRIPLSPDLPTQITQIYFRLLMPLMALLLLWFNWSAAAHNRLFAALVSVSLLIFSVLNLLLPDPWQRWVRLGLAAWAALGMGAIALYSDVFAKSVTTDQFNTLLVVLPLSIASLHLLYFKEPGVGLSLSLFLTLTTTLTIARWPLKDLDMSWRTTLLFLIAGLLATLYGQAVANLQRQADLSREHSRRDALTGLHNRRAFDGFAQHAAPEGTLAMLDIDLFKVVNDTYGHDAGDRVLRAIGDVLLDQLSGQGQAYRWGGEEFVVFIPHASQLDAVAVLNRVREEIGRRSFAGGAQITLSAGLSRTGPGLPLSVSFQQADQALFLAKQAGRNRVVVWEQDPDLARRAPTLHG